MPHHRVIGFFFFFKKKKNLSGNSENCINNNNNNKRLDNDKRSVVGYIYIDFIDANQISPLNHELP